MCLYRGWCGGGLVPAADFTEMKRTAADGLQDLLHKRTRIDGVFLDLHGAMGCEGCDDAEAELVEAMRCSASQTGVSVV